MADIRKVISLLKEQEKFCIECYQPEWMLADTVVSELSKFDTSEYNIFEIFAKDVIEKYILSPGEECLLAGIVGGKLENLIKADSQEAKVVDHTDMVPLYQRVFDEWEKAGWITLEKVEGSDRSISVRISDVS